MIFTNISIILSFISGLALFLYGMSFMSAELEKASGGRLERALERFSSGILQSFLLGTAVTALIQSSSATTVMVIGFVNSGIMKLSAATGIIIGANLGTTVTSWILSLTGISEGAFLVSLLDPSFFAPILAIIGVFMRLFSKKTRAFDVGGMILGFSLLMIGMTLMSDSLAPLSQNESFTSILTLFQNPLAGILAGTLLTAVIQSSSASVGILQALSLTGALPYSIALPIVMGQNIGTCATALISSVGTDKNAKCAAFIHLYFNVIGTLLISVVFYSLNALIAFPFLDSDATPVDIALAHTLFNLISTLLLLPFSSYLERLALFTVGKRKDDESTSELHERLLDQRFLSSPSFALDVSRETFKKMICTATETARLSISLALRAQNERQIISSIEEKEDLVDKYEESLRRYLLKIKSDDLTRSEEAELYRLLASIGEAEHICDRAYDLSRIITEMHRRGKELPLAVLPEFKIYLDAVEEAMNITLEAVNNKNTVAAHQVEPLVRITSLLCTELRSRNNEALLSGKIHDEGYGSFFNDILSDLEDICELCSTLALLIIRSHLGGNEFDSHEYLHAYASTAEYRAAYQRFKKKYAI